MQNYIRSVVLVAFLCWCTQAQIPFEFEKCKRSDDDFNECLKIAIQDAIPKCKNGIPEMDIPRLEPLNIPEMVVGEGATGAVRVVQRYSDIHIYNLTHAIIDKISATITPTEFKLTIEATMPEFVWDSNYSLSGRILLLPISGEGKSNAKGTDVVLNLSFAGKIYDKKGKKHIKVITTKIDLTPGGFNIQLKNLFNGDERLGAEMNKFLNENWKELWLDAKPNYEALFEKIFLNYTNRFFKKVPLGAIFSM